MQLFHVSEAAKALPQEKRSIYRERVTAHLEKRPGGLFNDQDLRRDQNCAQWPHPSRPGGVIKIFPGQVFG
jgi:hypothetical protein